MMSMALESVKGPVHRAGMGASDPYSRLGQGLTVSYYAVSTWSLHLPGVERSFG